MTAFNILQLHMQLIHFDIKRMIFVGAVLGATSACGTPQARGEIPREHLLLDSGWKFTLENPPNAQAADFTDSTWCPVDLPHDWSIAGKIDRNNPMGATGGFFPAGVGWYRRSFIAPPAWSGRQVSIEFEGVYMNADVWLNGQHLGFHPNGYTTFSYNLTAFLKPAETNVLAVRVDNSKQKNSRWYSGSGIYRHVWLTVTGPVHVPQWGLCITTPEVSLERAQVRMMIKVVNETKNSISAKIDTVLLGPDDKNVGATNQLCEISGGMQTESPQEVTVLKPSLWSPESPRLYRAVTSISVAGKLVDELETRFGIRSIHVSAENGFQLNGRAIKLCGGCIHDQNGCLGVAAFDRAEQRQVELLKDAGFNAVRLAHNPAAPALLDACDRLGLLVLDESFDAWEQPKRKFDYSTYFDEWWQRDLAAMVLRDRNHPSVIMWGIGNEIPERADSSGIALTRELSAAVRVMDPTRPVTAALNNFGNKPRHKWSDTDAAYALLDVAGGNYVREEYESDHQRNPERVIVTTESFPAQAFEFWKTANDHPYVIGDFVWSARDYLGESGAARVVAPQTPVLQFSDDRIYPWHGVNCGDLNLCGFRKPISYYRDIIWNRGNRVYPVVIQPDFLENKLKLSDNWGVIPSWPSWTWPGQEGKNVQVEVYSACDRVRLFLNDELIGEQASGQSEKFKSTFSVPYRPGKLKAIGVQNGKPVVESMLQTAGAAARVRLKPDRTVLQGNGQDLSFITVEVTDLNGLLQPDATNLIHFGISGPGIIAGVDNGDLSGEEKYNHDERCAFHGRLLVVVRTSQSPGKIKLTAQADGLAQAEVTLKVVAPETRSNGDLRLTE
jgi:beta-galactosidase